jgi:hypothetical protein
MAHEWIAQLAEKERQRREDYAMLRNALKGFSSEIERTIFQCLNEYNHQFPGELPLIDVTGDGEAMIIRRLGEAGMEVYPPKFPAPTVQFIAIVPAMTLRCSFSHLQRGSFEFKLFQREDGTVGLAEGGSLEDFCQSILAPILFPKLAEWV